MMKFDGIVGGSANDRLWNCLVGLAEKLCGGEVQLDDLVRGVEKNKSADYNYNNCVAAAAVPRNNTTTGKKKSTLKITLKIMKKLPAETSMGMRNPSFNGKGSRRGSERLIINTYQNPRPIDLSEEVKKQIVGKGGSLQSLVLVIQKKLFKTDVSASHGRLSIPQRKVENQFLGGSEVRELEKEEGMIAVDVIQPCLKECKMSLRNWKSILIYALVGDWKEVVRRNGLEEGMTIQLWSFRNDSKLCFALVRID